MRYVLVPFSFSDRSCNFSFLRIVPARKPRIECGCHPVALTRASRVAPSGFRSKVIMRSCFDSSGAFRLVGSFALGFFAPAAERTGVRVLVAVFRAARAPMVSVFKFAGRATAGSSRSDASNWLFEAFTRSSWWSYRAIRRHDLNPAKAQSAGGGGDRSGLNVSAPWRFG